MPAETKAFPGRDGDTLFDTPYGTANRQAPQSRPLREGLDRGPRPGPRDPAPAPARVRRAARLQRGRRVRRPRLGHHRDEAALPEAARGVPKTRARCGAGLALRPLRPLDASAG